MIIMNKLYSVLTDEQVLRGVLVGTIIVADSWKLYLIFRNILMLRDMPDAPNELEINPVVYDKMQQITRYESKRFLSITIIELNIKVAKLVFNYFPYLWMLTGEFEYGKSLVARAVWFTTLDNCLEVAAAIPLVFLSSVITGMGNPLLLVFDETVEMVFRSLLAAFATYGIIYVTDKFGVSSILKWHLASNALGLIVMVFYYKFMMSFNYERLPENDTGRLILGLAKDVGYPTDTIYVDKRAPEPNAYYCSAIFSKTIIITEPLLTSLDAPQATSVVAHELGHWAHYHPIYTYLGNTIEILAMGYFWIFTYGNSKLVKVFQLDPGVHSLIPVYMSFYFIWPPFKNLFQGIFNLFKSHLEFVADDYACTLWSPKSLRQALVKVSLKMKSFPLLDSWFAAWFIGHPSVLRRIRRIDDIIKNKDI